MGAGGWGRVVGAVRAEVYRLVAGMCGLGVGRRGLVRECVAAKEKM